MKILRILHYINIATLAIIVPYVIFFKDLFFYSKHVSLALPTIIMFLVTFVCSGAIMIKANRSNIDNSLSLDGLKLIDKKLIIYVIACFIVGNILNFLFSNNDFQVFYFIFSFICSLFVLFDNVQLKLIGHSVFSRVGPSAWIYAIPFMFFGVIMALEINEVITFSDNQILDSFIIYGILLVLIVWGCPVYTVDITNSTISYADDFMCSWIMWLKGKDKEYHFEDIKRVEKTKFFYKIEFPEHTIKIPKIYINTKNLIMAFENLGIYVIDL